MMFRCLRHSVPRYMSDFCMPIANVAARSLTTVRQTSSSRCSTLQQVHVWPPRLLCSWSDDPELSHRQTEWSIVVVVHWHFSSPAQNISVLQLDPEYLAHLRYFVDALYKSMFYLLTYLLTRGLQLRLTAAATHNQHPSMYVCLCQLIQQVRSLSHWLLITGVLSTMLGRCAEVWGTCSTRRLQNSELRQNISGALSFC